MAIFKEPELIEQIGKQIAATPAIQHQLSATMFKKELSDLYLALSIRDAAFSIVHIGSTKWYGDYGKAVEAHHPIAPQAVFSAISRNELKPDIYISEAAAIKNEERYNIAATALTKSGIDFEEQTIDDVLYLWTPEGIHFAVANFKEDREYCLPTFPEGAGPLLRFTPTQSANATEIMVQAQNAYLEQTINHPDSPEGKKYNFKRANPILVSYDINKLCAQHIPYTKTHSKQESIMLSLTGRHLLI